MKQRFTSRVLPPYKLTLHAAQPEGEEVLPVLYLRGLSTGDFKEALPALLGTEAKAGIIPTTISRLTAEREEEYRHSQRRDLRGRDYDFVWVDGIHFRFRLEEDRLCALVIIGVRPDGTKALVALEDGYRESTESRASLLRVLTARGMRAPALAIGGGVRAIPCRLRRQVPEAVATLTRNQDELLTFYDFPTERWKHTRTTNVVESPFATVRLRQRVTKGAGSRMKGLTMAYKLLDMAEKRWRKLNSSELLPLVRACVRFTDGIMEAPFGMASRAAIS